MIDFATTAVIPHRHVDVAIIGGGPAGSACATLIARAGGRVAVVEAGRFDRPRFGELLEPGAARWLEQMRFPADLLQRCARESLGLACAWGRGALRINDYLFRPHGNSRALDRRAFDEMLFHWAAHCGACAVTSHRCVHVGREDQHWHLQLAQASGFQSLRADWLVDASGRCGGALSNDFSDRTHVDSLFAFFSRVNRADDDPLRDLPLLEATPRGWFYSLLLADGELLVGFFTDLDLLPRMRKSRQVEIDRYLCETEHTRKRCKSPGRLVPWIARDARMGLRRKAAAQRYFACGDALLSYDPLSGQGIDAALQSGCEVAELILNGARPEHSTDWAERVAERWNLQLAERGRAYALEDRYANAPFWQRRHVG